MGLNHIYCEISIYELFMWPSGSHTTHSISAFLHGLWLHSNFWISSRPPKQRCGTKKQIICWQMAYKLISLIIYKSTLWPLRGAPQKS